jgi:tripartite-type tricarboxylate transporter receptor subunit TctC
MDRRDLLTRAGALLAYPLLSERAAAQAWPSRPIRIVTGDAAGGAVDSRLREFIVPLAQELKTQIVVDNKPGAGNQISHQYMITQPADGYTLLLANATIAIFPSLFPKLPYSPLRDFQPVAYSGLSAIALAIPASHPARSLKEWVEWARTQKGKLNYASGGNGSVASLYGYQASEQFGLKATHVPYKTAIQFLPDLASARIDFTMLDIFSTRPFVTRGDVRLLAVTGEERSKFLPDVPTFKELGLQGYERMGWSAYYARAGTPPEIVERLSAAIDKVSASPEWVAKRDLIWSIWRRQSTQQLTERIRSETEAWGELVKRSGFRAD